MPRGETSLILLCCSTVCCSLNYYTSMLSVLHKHQNFFCVANFDAAILVCSARFGNASCSCNFPFFSTTYVRPLSHLSLRAFVTFLFLHFAVPYFSYFAVTFLFHKLMGFPILSFISLTWWSLWVTRRLFYVLLFYRLLLFKLLYVNTFCPT